MFTIFILHTNLILAIGHFNSYLMSKEFNTFRKTIFIKIWLTTITQLLLKVNYFQFEIIMIAVSTSQLLWNSLVLHELCIYCSNITYSNYSFHVELNYVSNPHDLFVIAIYNKIWWCHNLWKGPTWKVEYIHTYLPLHDVILLGIHTYLTFEFIMCYYIIITISKL